VTLTHLIRQRLSEKTRRRIDAEAANARLLLDKANLTADVTRLTAEVDRLTVKLGEVTAERDQARWWCDNEHAAEAAAVKRTLEVIGERERFRWIADRNEREARAAQLVAEQAQQAAANAEETAARAAERAEMDRRACYAMADQLAVAEGRPTSADMVPARPVYRGLVA
jgi:hypothetical protein